MFVSGVGGLRFKSWTGQIGHRVSHRCGIFSKGAAVLPGRSDTKMGPENSLQASAYYCEYSILKDLIWTCFHFGKKSFLYRHRSKIFFFVWFNFIIRSLKWLYRPAAVTVQLLVGGFAVSRQKQINRGFCRLMFELFSAFVRFPSACFVLPQIVFERMPSEH